MQISVCGLVLKDTADGVDMRNERTGEGFVVPHEIVDLVGEAMKTVKAVQMRL